MARRNKTNKSARTVEAPALPSRPAPAGLNWFFRGLAALAAVLGLWALYLAADQGAEAARLAASGWGDAGMVIVRNRVHALWHAAAMTAAAAAFVRLVMTSARTRLVAAAQWLLVALVAGDALWLSRHYIKAMPADALLENEVVRILRSDQPDRRAALVAQDGFYNFWLNYLLPYHNIRTVNVTQMPRMPEDYRRFLEAVGADPLRYWHWMAVGHVLAPAQFWGQVSQHPAMQDFFELVYAYNVAPLPGGFGVRVLPATPDQPGQHAVLRLKSPLPRYVLVAAWSVADDATTLRRMTDPEFQPCSHLLVAPEWGSDLPPSPGVGPTGAVRRIEYRPGYMRLGVSSSVPAILRIADKYDADWKARINGAPAPVRRVDFIFQGVLIEPGLHEVELIYAPSRVTLWLQMAALLACLAAAVRFFGPFA